MLSSRITYAFMLVLFISFCGFELLLSVLSFQPEGKSHISKTFLRGNDKIGCGWGLRSQQSFLVWETRFMVAVPSLCPFLSLSLFVSFLSTYFLHDASSLCLSFSCLVSFCLHSSSSSLSLRINFFTIYICSAAWLLHITSAFDFP